MDAFKVTILSPLVMLSALRIAAADPTVNVSQGMLLGKTENFVERLYLRVSFFSLYSKTANTISVKEFIFAEDLSLICKVHVCCESFHCFMPFL